MDLGYDIEGLIRELGACVELASKWGTTGGDDWTSEVDRVENILGAIKELESATDNLLDVVKQDIADISGSEESDEEMEKGGSEQSDDELPYARRIYTISYEDVATHLEEVATTLKGFLGSLWDCRVRCMSMMSGPEGLEDLESLAAELDDFHSVVVDLVETIENVIERMPTEVHVDGLTDDEEDEEEEDEENDDDDEDEAGNTGMKEEEEAVEIVEQGHAESGWAGGQIQPRCPPFS